VVVLIPLSNVDLVARPGTPRVSTGKRAVADEVVVGEWSLERAAWTDRHMHEEINYVLEGELHVTYDGETYVARTGDAVVVPAGIRARYAAPEFARMVFVYGPSTDGHAAFDTEYTELD
jgi:quercetin dioxygenase-like cupin family protein